jgi:uncharacterized protein with HEPN domain
LWDVAAACSDIARITNSSTFDAFLSEQDIRRLVERYLEIVGEALRQLEFADQELS